MTNTDTAVRTAAESTAAKFATLDEFDHADLISEAGLWVDVDGIDVSVWLRDSDDRIVAFRSDGDRECWAEVALVRSES